VIDLYIHYIMSNPLYLWISPGEYVGTPTQLHELDVKYKYVQSIIADNPVDLCKYISDPDGTPQIPTETLNNRRLVFVPPRVFIVSETDSNEIKQLSGLYFLEGNWENDMCQITSQNKLINHAGMADEDVFNGYGRKITYSQIISKINDDCKMRALNPNDVGVAFVSLHSELYPIPTEKIMDTIPLANVSCDNNTLYFLLYIENPEIPIPDLENELNIEHQGCGLSALSYYNIIDRDFANKKTVCLPHKGQSIFNILKYIQHYLHTKRGVPRDKKYCITRHTHNDAARIIFGLHTEMANKLAPGTQYCTIIKLYEKYSFGRPLSDSHMGHTISFLGVAGGKLSLIDTYAGGSVDIISADHLFRIFNAYNKYKYADIIWTESIPGYRLTSPEKIIRQNNINYGGKRNTRRKRKSHRKRKYTRKT